MKGCCINVERCCINVVREFVVVAVSSLTRVGLYCEPVDCSPPGSSVHGISQGKEYCSGLLFPSPGDVLNPGIERRKACN